jgi:hypothetical protein
VIGGSASRPRWGAATAACLAACLVSVPRQSPAAAGKATSSAAPAPRPADPPRARLPPAPSPSREDPAQPSRSNCGACHSEVSWSDARFDHTRTGFPLAAAHQRVSCRACHARDYGVRIADTCAGCHQDRHGGQLGLRCEGCHDERSWRETAFQADGHRATAFPLSGAHAAIPCQECHGDLRDRAFARAPLACVDCHRAAAAAAALRSIDHAAARFGDDCRACHDTWAFFPARFAAHDACFAVSTGSHRTLRCQSCHNYPATLTLSGQCVSSDVHCASCHVHGCDLSDRQHRNVMGYQCIDQKCAECHRQVPAR